MKGIVVYMMRLINMRSRSLSTIISNKSNAADLDTAGRWMELNAKLGMLVEEVISP